MASAQRKRVTGTVKWFNAKDGFGFITRHDNGEDIFVHHSCILKPNQRHSIKSVGKGEEVEFGVIASKVTGPGFKSVKGSKFVALRGGRKSRPGSRTNGRRSKGSVGKENSEGDISKELAKRTEALTIKLDTNVVESVKLEREVVCEECVETKPVTNAANYERSDDKTSSDKCGDAKSAELIKEDKTTSDEYENAKSDTNAVKSESSKDAASSDACGDTNSAESIKEEKTSSDECEDTKSDTDEVELGRSDDKTSSDECEDAQSAESISTVTAEY